MIVEHSFVTTLEQDVAMQAMHDLLTPLGFASAPVPKDVFHLDWSRGASEPYKSSFVLKRPQRVRAEFDRGRMTIAASARTARNAEEKLFEPLMLALATAAEAHVGKGEPIESALVPVRAANEVLRRKDRRRMILIIILLALPVMLIVGAIVAAITM